MKWKRNLIATASGAILKAIADKLVSKMINNFGDMSTIVISLGVIVFIAFMYERDIKNLKKEYEKKPKKEKKDLWDSNGPKGPNNALG